MQNNRAVGSQYEQQVGSYLEEKGYEIICYNYRCKLGEIDIVAKQGDILVFIEVKYRKNPSRGNPLEAVTAKKQHIISKCANYYIMCHYKYDIPCRFDVIGVMGIAEQKEITHIENAFEYC